MIEVLEKLPGETAKKYATRVLVYNIVNVNMVPGERIMEAELCELLNMSRTPIREAILELTQNRLIDIFPQRGTYVSYIDPELVEQVRDLRMVLEVELARSACDLLKREDLDSLREVIAIQKYYNEVKNSKKLLMLDKKFHSEIYRMCQKGFWDELAESVAAHFDRSRILSYQCRIPELVISDHEKLLDAIAEGNREEACSVTRLHMSRAVEDRPLIQKHFPEYFKS